MIPLYGFLEGDTIGLLVLAAPDDRLDALAAKLIEAASLRVAPPARFAVRVRGQRVPPAATVAQVGLEALDRIDVVREEVG